jgi:O-antigen/teichoic acid export membrane protein
MTSLRKALVWSVAERYASLVISLAASMIIARLLTPAEVGVFSLCAAAVAIATMVREFGVNEYIVQEKQLDEAKLRSAFAVAFTTAWGIGALLFLVRGPLAEFYGEPRVAQLLGILCLNFVLLPFSSPAFALLNRAIAVRQIFTIQLSTTVAQSGASVLLAWQGFGSASLAWASLAGVAVQTLVIGLLRPRGSFVWPSFSGAARVFRYGAYQMGARLADTLSGNAHEFIIARQFDFAAVGLFSRAKGLVDMFQANVTTAITRVATPSLARAHRENGPLADSFARGTALFTGIAWPFFGYVALTAPEIIRVMLGTQWGAAAPLVTVLAIGMLPSGLTALSGSVMAAMGQVERRLKVALVYNPIHVLALLVMAQFGLLAIAATWLLTTLSTWAAYTWHLCRLLRVGPRALYGASLVSVPLALASVAAQWAAVEAARQLNIPALLVLALTALAGLLAWGVAVKLLAHPAGGELQRVLDRLRPARPSPP